MSTLLVTHPCFVLHDTGEGHPERPDRMRVLDTAFATPEFAALQRAEAPLRPDVEDWIALAHPRRYIEAIEKKLWSAADTLRANSNYASNEYFLPVMGLVFLSSGTGHDEDVADFEDDR